MVKALGSSTSPSGALPPRKPAGAAPRRLALADEIDQPALAPAVHLQQFLVGNLVHLFPDAGVVEALAPVGLQVLVVKLGQVAIQPTGQVDAVGDRGDGHFPDRQLRPQVVEHLLRNLAVQPADGIAVGRGIQRQHGHGEALVAVVDVAPAQRHQLLEVDADLGAVTREIVVHQRRGRTDRCRRARACGW